MAATPWSDFIRKSNNNELMVFPGPGVTASASWNRIFQKALDEFNRLSGVHKLGVTLVRSLLRPQPDGDGGADVQFEAASGTARGKSLGHEFSEPFSGSAVHGLTIPFIETVVGSGAPPQIAKAFCFVPSAPKVMEPVIKPPARLREVGDEVKLVIAVHELIHAVSGLGNSDHSPENNPDVFVGPPIVTPTVEAGSKPDDDKLRVGTHPNFTRFPPIFLTARTAAMIQAVWT